MRDIIVQDEILYTKEFFFAYFLNLQFFNIKNK